MWIRWIRIRNTGADYIIYILVPEEKGEGAISSDHRAWCSLQCYVQYPCRILFLFFEFKLSVKGTVARDGILTIPCSVRRIFRI